MMLLFGGRKIRRVYPFNRRTGSWRCYAPLTLVNSIILEARKVTLLISNRLAPIYQRS